MNAKIVTPINQTVLIGTRWGMMLGLQCDPFQTSALMLYGEWSPYESDAICSCLPVGGVALDIGANIGTMAVAMSKKVGAGGRVFAFEPQRAAYACLCANSALTHCLTQLDPIRAAVADTDCVIQVPIVDVNKGFNVGGVRLNDPSYDAAMPMPKEEVPCVRIDSFGLQRCDVIKIDVETMEGLVLLGAKETIKRCQPVIFAETLASRDNEREMDNVRLMLATLDELKYDVRLFAPDLYSPTNIRFCPDNIFPGKDTNICAWPAGKEKPEWFNQLQKATL